MINIGLSKLIFLYTNILWTIRHNKKHPINSEADMCIGKNPKYGTTARQKILTNVYHPASTEGLKILNPVK